MLQGNPFETEQFVEERREAVRHGVEQQRQPGTAQGHRKVGGWLSRMAPGRREAQGWRLPVALVLSALRKSQTD